VGRGVVRPNLGVAASAHDFISHDHDRAHRNFSRRARFERKRQRFAHKFLMHLKT
jgi:hypothetical protein